MPSNRFPAPALSRIVKPPRYPVDIILFASAVMPRETEVRNRMGSTSPRFAGLRVLGFAQSPHTSAISIDAIFLEKFAKCLRAARREMGWWPSPRAEGWPLPLSRFLKTSQQACTLPPASLCNRHGATRTDLLRDGAPLR